MSDMNHPGNGIISFSIVTPVYNCGEQTAELLESLTRQTYRNFEIILIEDGSGDSQEIAEKYRNKLRLQYYYLKNSGVSHRRNYGISNARSSFFIFFDSDCIIPEDYFEKLDHLCKEKHFDAFGGKDAALKNFTPFQQAVNYAMTSFLTTGGIRGSKKKIDKFYPRSFNMGFSREVFQETGGFPEDITPPGEDMILSIRIYEKGFKVESCPDLFVYHKRKTSFKRFFRQIYSFAYVRLKISFLYPDTFKLFYLLPVFFTLYCLLTVVFAPLISGLLFFPLFLYSLLVFTDAWIKTGKLQIAILSVGTSFTQFWAYGSGFFISLCNKILKKKHR